MHFGVTMFATDVSMPVHELAREAEARGFHSLYIPEHTHIPSSRLTPPPMGGDRLADEYSRTVDPFVALSAAVAITERIRVGTGVCLVAQHDPIVAAKAVATLDTISNGRFEFGIGFGWNREEMKDHGVDFATRREHAREHLLAMRALWTEDEASFDGEFVRFEPTWSWPKPVQPGGPPVLIGGGGGPKLFAAIADYADGWIPIGGGGIRAALPDLHRACESVGRDPSTLRIVPFGTIPDQGKLEYYSSLGIEEIVLRVPSGTADETLPLLDTFADLANA
jgi:probable F420-dependent oxidoreductase